MTRSRKLINCIYISVFLLIICAGAVIIGSRNRTIWESRKKIVDQNTDFAIESFISYTQMIDSQITPSLLKNLTEQISSSMDECIRSFSIRTQSSQEIANEQIISFFSGEKENFSYHSESRIDFADTSYYMMIESDFSDLNKSSLRFWHIYAASAAALIILGAALLIILNMLWIETSKTKKFMENFTHELKTPITSILGYSDLMEKYYLDPGEQEQALKALSFEANRLNSLSKQMLDIFITQNEKPEFSDLDSGIFCKKLIFSLDALSSKYDIDYAIRFDPGTFAGNEALLLSLVTNLADNAFKATVNAAKKDPVIIRGAHRNEHYFISVSDRGTGINKENLNKITEPFYREDKARSRKQGGAGLGLALCSEIAKLHGSKLVFRSKKNKGTSVSISLTEVKA